VQHLLPIRTDETRGWFVTDDYQSTLLSLQYDYELLKARLAGAHAELSHPFFPKLEGGLVDSSETNPWGQLDLDSDICTEWRFFAEDAVEVSDRYWKIHEFCRAMRRKNFDLLERWCKVCGTAVNLLLKPVFWFLLILRERDWCLLHGSHPPRQNAGISTPVFAMPRGRAWREQGSFLAQSQIL
jgi:hypothetical protein